MCKWDVVPLEQHQHDIPTKDFRINRCSQQTSVTFVKNYARNIWSGKRYQTLLKLHIGIQYDETHIQIRTQIQNFNSNSFYSSERHNYDRRSILSPWSKQLELRATLWRLHKQGWRQGVTDLMWSSAETLPIIDLWRRLVNSLDIFRTKIHIYMLELRNILSNYF